MAEIGDIPFTPEEFDVDIYQFSHMLLIDNPVSEQLDTYYTFTNNERDYQIRYSFFKQTSTNDANIRAAYSFMILLIIWNIAGYEEMGISNFNDSDVYNEYYGDFGSTVFIHNPKSDFGTGFKYILLNIFYKQNQGIVVQSILFNNFDFLQNKIFMEVFHSFKFHD